VAILRALGRLSSPIHLLLAGLTYVLGAGIARYLGFPVQARLLILGLLVIVLLQLAMEFLAAVFLPVPGKMQVDQTPAEQTQVRRAALHLAIAALAAAVVLAASLFRFEVASVGPAICLGLCILVIIVHSMPPMLGVNRGFGELLVAVQIAFLVPTLSFLLQAGTYHRLLNLCTVALTCLLLASLIALDFHSYAEDLRNGRTTLLTRLGWERGLTIHHTLLGMAYFILGLAVLLGFSMSLIGPAFLAIPFAVLQVVMLQAMARGAKPIWDLLRANALAVFALAAYFLTVSFWLR
jgi:1,4-dihydroxy-2-naphthoate octaprenyltransferase